MKSGLWIRLTSVVAMRGLFATDPITVSTDSMRGVQHHLAHAAHGYLAECTARNTVPVEWNAAGLQSSQPRGVTRADDSH